MFAAEGGHTDIVALLLERGAEVDRTNQVSVVLSMSLVISVKLFIVFMMIVWMVFTDVCC